MKKKHVYIEIEYIFFLLQFFIIKNKDIFYNKK